MDTITVDLFFYLRPTPPLLFLGEEASRQLPYPVAGSTCEPS